MCSFEVERPLRGRSTSKPKIKKIQKKGFDKKNMNSSYEKVLTIHPSGNLVAKSIARQYQFDIQEVFAFASREDIRKNISLYLHNILFMPMPVHVSPIICYISPKEWESRYWDSVGIISLFVQIMHTYVFSDFTIFHTKNKDRIEKEHKVFLEEIRALDSKCIPTLKELTNYKDFVKVMEVFTIDRINVYERFFYKLLQLDAPIECFMTPQLSLPAKCLPMEAQKTGPAIMCHFFDTKQHIACKDDKEFPFDIKDMKTRLQRLPAEQIYNGYMDKLTAEEYMNFIKKFVN